LCQLFCRYWGAGSMRAGMKCCQIEVPDAFFFRFPKDFR
jgi:hypothetical protein